MWSFPEWTWSFLFSLTLWSCGWAQQQLQQVLPAPKIQEVSAMCSPQGITAQVMFDGPFYGKIYSRAYPLVHDCVYYNVLDMQMVLFTIPNYKCGTRLTRNSRNVVDYIENEVYVQYDKDTQTENDRRYMFICELTAASIDVTATARPTHTIIVQTIQPTRIVATQVPVNIEPDVTMEIQQGVGPFETPVAEPLKLGDVITLVVRGKAAASTSVDQYNMFVHSCTAADGTGANKVELIDRSGCTVRAQVAGQMQRMKTDNGETLYFFRMSAFKFPGPNDVYFSCEVDVCLDCNFAGICPAKGRQVRSVHYSRNSSAAGKSEERRLELHDYIRIKDLDSTLFGEESPLDGVYRSASSVGDRCFSSVTLYAAVGCIVSLLLALIVLTVYILSQFLWRRRLRLGKQQQTAIKNCTAQLPSAPPGSRSLGRPPSSSNTSSTTSSHSIASRILPSSRR